MHVKASCALVSIIKHTHNTHTHTCTPTPTHTHTAHSLTHSHTHTHTLLTHSLTHTPTHTHTAHSLTHSHTHTHTTHSLTHSHTHTTIFSLLPRLFHIIVDTDRTASQILSVMNKQKMPGEVTFLPLNKLQSSTPEYPNSKVRRPILCTVSQSVILHTWPIHVSMVHLHVHVNL